LIFINLKDRRCSVADEARRGRTPVPGAAVTASVRIVGLTGRRLRHEVTEPPVGIEQALQIKVAEAWERTNWFSKKPFYPRQSLRASAFHG
jgi:hypothetical protein